MPNYVVVNPSSGDDFTNAFDDASATSDKRYQIPKGTVLKVIGEEGQFYKVKYSDPNEPKVAGGDPEATEATVYTDGPVPIYKDPLLKEQYAEITNDQMVKIEERTSETVYKVTAATRARMYTGYMESRFLMCMTLDEGDPPTISKQELDDFINSSIPEGGEEV